jgi:ATP-dependent exoDNAse (exonuclease V) beta subunit
LEADVVYILRPELLPLVRKNQQDWELEQEMNIKYVALTRAKQKMVMVSSK